MVSLLSFGVDPRGSGVFGPSNQVIGTVRDIIISCDVVPRIANLSNLAKFKIAHYIFTTAICDTLCITIYIYKWVSKSMSNHTHSTSLASPRPRRSTCRLQVRLRWPNLRSPQRCQLRRRGDRPCLTSGGFHGVLPDEWFIVENPIKVDDLEVPLFQETPIWCLFVGISAELSMLVTVSHHQSVGVWIGCAYRCFQARKLNMNIYGPNPSLLQQDSRFKKLSATTRD